MSTKPLDADIAAFMSSHHVFVLGTEDKGQPYATPLFYVFEDDDPALVFASVRETRHVRELGNNWRACGAVYVDTRDVSKIQGAQFTGPVTTVDETEQGARKRYAQSFPEIERIGAPLWRLRIATLKYTDNRESFGKKRMWAR